MSINTDTCSKFISVQEAAKDLCVSEQFLFKMIRKGTFPAKTIKISTVVRIERASWNAFLECNTEEKAPAPRRGRPTKPAPALDLQRQREISFSTDSQQ